MLPFMGDRLTQGYIGISLFVVLLLSGCGENVDESLLCEGCNVIFISLTNARADHMGFMGYGRDTTSQLDALAEQSIVFEDAYTVASWTLRTVST